MASDMSDFPYGSQGCVAYIFMNTAQTSNLATNDHIMFDTVSIQPKDTRIIVDVKSSYTTSAGPSIGRFSLKPGLIYDLQFDVYHAGFSISSGFLSCAFYDVVSGVYISTSIIYRAVSSGNNSGSSSSVRCIYAPQTSNLIEVRIRDVSSLTQIGLNSPPDVSTPTLVIKTI